MDVQVHCAYDELVDPNILVSNSRNPNTHPPKQIKRLRKNIEQLGWRAPITVSNRSGFIVRGHGRLEAALLSTPLAQVPVDRQDYESEAAEWANLIADNVLQELSKLDKTLQNDLLAELTNSDIDMELTGYSLDDLAAMAPDVAATDDDFDPDAADTKIITPLIQPGDIWMCGDHRVMCADSTDAEAWMLLFGETLADMMWTDPPYGVNIVGRTGEHLTIENDDAAGLPELLKGAFTCADQYLVPGAPFYIAQPSGRQSLDFGHAVLECNWLWHETLCWKKQHYVLSHCDYHQQYEPILYGWTRMPDGGSHPWYGNRDKSSVLEFDRPMISRLHPTMKPIPLVADGISNSSRRGELVVDPFLGSGSTLIAAEQLERICYGMELSTRYCQVILERWQQASGELATCLQTGETLADRARASIVVSENVE